MAATKKNTVETILGIKPVEEITVHVRVRGTSPLIMHKWSEKARKEILAKQMKTSEAVKKGHDPKNPTQDFIESAYWLSEKPSPDSYGREDFEAAIPDGARFGFPATAFKQAAISAAYRAGVVPNMTGLRAAFFIDGIGDDQLVEIKSDKPICREDMVKIAMGTADVRHRPQFNNWTAMLTIRYNKNGAFSLEQILSVLQLGGFSNGIGEWRPERDGNYGTFTVDNLNTFEMAVE